MIARRHLTLAEVQKHTGLTYRRIDWWVRRGVLDPLGEAAPRSEGSGTQRLWTPEAVQCLTVCRRIADCTSDVFARAGGQVSFSLDTLQLIVGALADRGFPTCGWLAACGDAAVIGTDSADVGELLALGDAWVFTALAATDRPE